MPLSPEVQVNEIITGHQYDPAVDVRENGDFVVVWTDFQITQPDIAGRNLDATGQPSGSQFQVNFQTAGYQYYPSVAAYGNDFVVVWQGPGIHNGDVDGTSIQMRGTFGLLFQDGFESGELSFWDAATP